VTRWEKVYIFREGGKAMFFRQAGKDEKMRVMRRWRERRGSAKHEFYFPKCLIHKLSLNLISLRL
jgi:hypothetical protein